VGVQICGYARGLPPRVDHSLSSTLSVDVQARRHPHVRHPCLAAQAEVGARRSPDPTIGPSVVTTFLIAAGEDGFQDRIELPTVGAALTMLRISMGSC